MSEKPTSKEGHMGHIETRTTTGYVEDTEHRARKGDLTGPWRFTAEAAEQDLTDGDVYPGPDEHAAAGS